MMRCLNFTSNLLQIYWIGDFLGGFTALLLYSFSTYNKGIFKGVVTSLGVVQGVTSPENNDEDKVTDPLK